MLNIFLWAYLLFFISSLKKCLFKSFAHFTTEFLSLLLNCKRSLHILIEVLDQIQDLQFFPCSVGFFTFLKVSFEELKTLILMKYKFYITESFCCTPKINTTLLINYTLIKINKKKNANAPSHFSLGLLWPI